MTVRLWPRSLFARLALLLIAGVVVWLAATIVFFHQDRAALLARQFDETRIVQLQAVRAALEAADPSERREAIRRIAREYGVRIVPEDERRVFGAGMPLPRRLQDFEDRLRERLGAGTDLRFFPGRGAVLVRLEADGAGYWIGVPFAPRPSAEDVPGRALVWSLSLAAVLIIAAFLFARYLARPLRELSSAAEKVGRGETPPPLPESGPSEIAQLNRGFNRMTANLRQLEQDRALLLAGVSHDLRTPLARLRLGMEMRSEDAATREGMIADIEEMDRIIGQFLDFARSDHETARERRDPNVLVAQCVDRYAKAGRDVRFVARSAGEIPLKPTAFTRLVANLIDNALAYGAPPVDVTTYTQRGRFVVDVADRGPGIPATDVERLKQPFTRASAARTSENGVAGAGLGLAIVDRIARMHGGTFELLPRDGGGTIARVELPAAA
jgi:two-component system osmolarity sensor histidine kinase EnvZ